MVLAIMMKKQVTQNAGAILALKMMVKNIVENVKTLCLLTLIVNKDTGWYLTASLIAKT